MRQVWRHLLFLHFPVEPEELSSHMPGSLDLDLYPDEHGVLKAWLGVVVFAIEGIRPFGLPPLPGLAGFAEANVRTYVHRAGKDPSILFLSLDGGPWLTRTMAGRQYGVPYVRAATSLQPLDGGFHFQSRRRQTGFADFRYRPESLSPTPAPDSLEYFLLERYQLLAPVRGRLKRARVWHKPYRPQAVVYDGATDLPQAHGLRQRPFTLAMYCDDVHAEFFPAEWVD